MPVWPTGSLYRVYYLSVTQFLGDSEYSAVSLQPYRYRMYSILIPYSQTARLVPVITWAIHGQ